MIGITLPMMAVCAPGNGCGGATSHITLHPPGLWRKTPISDPLNPQPPAYIRFIGSMVRAHGVQSGTRRTPPLTSTNSPCKLHTRGQRAVLPFGGKPRGNPGLFLLPKIENYLDTVTAMILRRYLRGRSDTSTALFVGRSGKRLGIDGLRAVFVRLGAISGVTGVHPHRFRRTTATRLINRGMPVQDVAHVLGHENINTTMRYVHISDASVRYEYQRCAG